MIRCFVIHVRQSRTETQVRCSHLYTLDYRMPHSENANPAKPRNFIIANHYSALAQVSVALTGHCPQWQEAARNRLITYIQYGGGLYGSNHERATTRAPRIRLKITTAGLDMPKILARISRGGGRSPSPPRTPHPIPARIGQIQPTHSSAMRCLGATPPAGIG